VKQRADKTAAQHKIIIIVACVMSMHPVCKPPVPVHEGAATKPPAVKEQAIFDVTFKHLPPDANYGSQLPVVFFFLKSYEFILYLTTGKLRHAP